MRPAALAFLAAVSVLEGQQDAKPPLKEEVRTIRDLAMSAPPELAADLLIRLSTTPALDRYWKIEFLDEAFQLAGAGRHAFPLQSAVGEAGHTDSDAGVLQRGLRAGLSVLELQVRAIRGTLPLNRAKAREMADSMPALRFPPLRCADSVRPAVGRWYEMAAELFHKGFTGQEKQRGRDLQFLESHIRQIQSPFQLEAAARMMLPLRTQDFERLVVAFAAALKEMRTDDRSFSATDGLTQPYYDLVRAAQKANLPTLPMVDAYRTYLTAHLGAARCADTAGMKDGSTSLTNMVALFNTSLLKMTNRGNAEVNPISEEELEPSRLIDERAKVNHFWSTPVTKKLWWGWGACDSVHRSSWKL